MFLHTLDMLNIDITKPMENLHVSNILVYVSTGIHPEDAMLKALTIMFLFYVVFAISNHVIGISKHIIGISKHIIVIYNHINCISNHIIDISIISLLFLIIS